MGTRSKDRNMTTNLSILHDRDYILPVLSGGNACMFLALNLYPTVDPPLRLVMMWLDTYV